MNDTNRFKGRSRSQKHASSTSCSIQLLFCGIISFLCGCLVCGILLQSKYIMHQTSNNIQLEFESDFTSQDTLRSNPSHSQKMSTDQVMTTAMNSNNNAVKDSSATKNTNAVLTTKNTNTNAVLADQRILIALASFDFSQFPLLEEVLDGYHGLAIAGAKVDLVIHTTVPYTVALLDLLNTRFGTCRGGDDDGGGFCIEIVVVSPAIRLNLVDLHRGLFYDKIQEYDLFIYSEVRSKCFLCL